MKKILTILLIIGLLFILAVYFLGGSLNGLINNPIAANQIVDIAKVAAVVIAVSLGALLLFPLMKVAIFIISIGILLYGLKQIFFSNQNNQLPKKL